MFLRRHQQLSRRTPNIAAVFDSISAFRRPSEHKNKIIRNRSLVTSVPPVTQNGAASGGPTAIVFLNMGGPSTVDEVGEFLRRLFVRRLNF